MMKILCLIEHQMKSFAFISMEYVDITLSGGFRFQIFAIELNVEYGFSICLVFHMFVYNFDKISDFRDSCAKIRTKIALDKFDFDKVFECVFCISPNECKFYGKKNTKNKQKLTINPANSNHFCNG